MKSVAAAAGFMLLWVALGMAQTGAEPERFRGEIVAAGKDALTLKTKEGRLLRFALPENLALFALSRASYADIEFGTYVGSVSERLGEDRYSPIVRDSLSWLHRGFELRIVDEKLRGIAVGHTRWDLTAASVMTHGWVDDQEDRVISIKYGPTEEEETDVEIPRDVPVVRMAPGERTFLVPGARALVGAVKGADGYVAAFVFVGRDGIEPGL